MDAEKELHTRLSRIAENVRFTRYVVCPHCGFPVILTAAEAGGQAACFRCESCRSVIEFNPVHVRPYPACEGAEPARGASHGAPRAPNPVDSG
jgi:hypothetical protein